MMRQESVYKQMSVLAYLHCQSHTWVQTRIRIANPVAALYYAEHVHIVQTQIGILVPISVQDRNLSPSPYPSPSPAIRI